MSEEITQWLKEIISLRGKQDAQEALQEIIDYKMSNNIDNSKKPWSTTLMQEATKKVTIQYMLKNNQWIPYIQGYHEVAEGCYCEQCTQARGQIRPQARPYDPRLQMGKRTVPQEIQYKPQGQRWNTAPTKWCRYCKRSGHEMEECFTRQHAEVTKKKYEAKRQEQYQKNWRYLPSGSKTQERYYKSLDHMTPESRSTSHQEAEDKEWKSYTLFGEIPSTRHKISPPPSPGQGTYEMDKQNEERLKKVKGEIDVIKKEIQDLAGNHWLLNYVLEDQMPLFYAQRQNIFKLRQDKHIWDIGLFEIKKAFPVNRNTTYKQVYRDINFQKGQCPSGTPMYSYDHGDCPGCQIKEARLQEEWLLDIREAEQAAKTLIQLKNSEPPKKEEWKTWITVTPDDILNKNGWEEIEEESSSEESSSEEE
jgi:hypothetical protein